MIMIMMMMMIKISPKEKSKDINTLAHYGIASIRNYVSL
jgi:hypothetical protein